MCRFAPLHGVPRGVTICINAAASHSTAPARLAQLTRARATPRAQTLHLDGPALAAARSDEKGDEAKDAALVELLRERRAAVEAELAGL